MPKFAIYGGVALLLLVGGAMYTIDSIARSAIETGVETGLGVPADVGSVRLRLLFGSFRMRDLEIANPEGYAADHFLKLGRAETTISYRALRQGDVVLKRLVLGDVELDLEWQGPKANYDAILDGIGGSTPEASETRFIIDELLIQNVVARLHLDSVLGSLEVREVKLPDLRLEGIGRKAGGIGMGELARHVVKRVLVAVMRQGKQLGPEFSVKLGSGLEQLRELGSGSTSDKIRKATEFFGKGREDGS